MLGAPDIEAVVFRHDEVVDSDQVLRHAAVASTYAAQTVQRAASPRTASRISAEISASSGRSTIGVNVPS